MVAEDIYSVTDGNASFLRAARAGNLEKVLEYLKGSIDINTSNANGLNALHLASKEGHVAVVNELLKRGANVNAATKKGNTALHIASLAGQEEVVKILVRNGANVNVQSQNGFTPLYMAAQENHDNVVRYLLANGANQSLATEDGFTPLAVALQQGHDKVVAVLLENDTKGRVRLPALHIAAKKDDCKAAALLLQNDHDPDVTSKSGFTPLHIASHYGNENIAHLLLEKSADVNFGAKHQITPLHVASKWGKKNMVTILVENGAKIDASTRDGLTPLHCAARSGHDQVVDLLLEKGAPITAKTKNGLAPLHMAAQGDHVDGARILLYHKAPVDDVTVDYLTALHVAAHCGHVKVAKLLLDRKADANARALNGFTPLHIACKKNRIKVVELLLKHGASIEATTESGLTPLHVASFMGCMNIVIYLIQHGANPDVPTVRGETPLHLAARANQADIIRILLRNGAHVDACAREQQTPLHIAARLGNVDIVGLLLQHGAAVDATTKDMYTALHIAAKEGQEEVASVLLDNGASLTATNKKGFTPLHLAAKYGNIKVARLLLQKDAPVDAQGKNGVTPLHVAAHYDHVNVALLLLDKGASPHATAKNGYTPLHIAAKKNQMDIATTLLEYGAKPNSESKAGFTPLHLASQEGHTDMTTLLIEHHADVNFPAKNGLTPLHLCAQEDRVNVAAILVKNGAEIGPRTKAGYTPLHVACHFGQINMVRFLLQHDADVNAITSHGYTPLHQAAQQGHTLIINLLLENNASPNTVTNQGQTALSIAQRLGYISVVETLKVVTETVVTTTTTTVTEEKYKVVAPEIMQETFMSDSEDEGGEDTMLGDQSFRYLTIDEMKSLGDDSLPIDVTKDERGTDSMIMSKDSEAPLTVEEEHLSPTHVSHLEAVFAGSYIPDNVDIARAPVHAGFLVSFMVDARGGAMRGCRHSGVRVIIPPRKAPMPMRITCRYLRKEKLAHPPPLMEGEACASRILEVGPAAAKFLGPVILEIPHFASLRGREREITILRSDNGETWKEHTLEATEDAVHDVLNESFEGEELSALEDLNTNRITRILTTDFPQYFAIITRVRQEVHAIGPEGGMVSSTVVPQVQAIFPEGALTKKIKVGLQAQPIPPELVAKLLGNRVAVSPIVTVEPRRRKFHKPITLTIPVPQAATKGMINQYSGDAPTLRLLCSITGGTTKAQWEDVTGSTPLTFVNDCVSFTTTVSARFWLMDCRQVNEATRFATELYKEAIHVPFMAKFVVFAKRYDPMEAYLRVFCMTDDKEDKTLESQEHFVEVAKSRDVEVQEAKCQYLEFAGNLIPVTKSGEQLFLTFQAFRENRLPFIIRVKDPHQEPMGRLAFMREPRVGRGEPPQSPICNLNIALPDVCKVDPSAVNELVTVEKKYGFIEETGLSKPELIHRADLRLSDISKQLGDDWIPLALQLDIPESDINLIKSENPNDSNQQAIVMLRLWMQKQANKANGNTLEKALRRINREDIVSNCMFNVELVTDDVEKAVAKVHLDQSGFDTFKEELGPSRDASLRRETSLEISYDEQDLMKEAESAAETSSESGSVCERDGHIKEAKKVPSPVEVTQPESRQEEVSATEEQNELPKPPVVIEVQELSSEEEKDETEREDDKSTTEEDIVLVDVNVSPPTSIDAKPAELSDDKSAVLEKELLEDLQQAFQDVSLSLPTVEGPVQIIKETKTPPPSPAERDAKADQETTVREKKEVLEDGTIKHTVTTVTKTTVTQDGDEPQLDKDQLAKLVESETWPSGEMDTSQVSVSSLPEDEKSEPTTATMSSGTTAEQDISSAEGDKPQVDTHTEEKEWTETDDSGGIRHVIQKKTIVTVSEPEEIMLMKGKAEPYLAGAANLPPGNSPDEKEEESLSFAEKRDFFQRLSMTAGEMPQSSSEETKVLKDANATDSSSSQPEEVIEEKVMRTEAIVEEQISFTERLRMFEEGKDDSKKAFPDKTKEDNEQKFELDKEELTESEIAALEYLEGKSSTLEECATDNLVVETQNTIKDVSLKETTSLDAVEQEVASMLAEVDRQSRELLGHAVGLLPEGEQPLTKLELAGDTEENEQEETRKHNLPNYQFPSKTDVSSTEFQYEMRGRDLVDIENEQENIKGRYDEMLTETKSSQQLSDEHAASVQFWPPQSPTTVKDENFMPEQQTAAGKTTTEDTVLPSPSKDSPSHKKAIGFDTSQSVQFSSGMEVDEPSMTSSHFVQSVPKHYPEQEEVLEMDINLSVKVQQQIKSQIFNEELDQSIEENPPEEKMLGISKLPDIEREKKMAQHIKTTILSQELEADIESGSPERKEFPSHSSSVESGFETLPTVGIVSPTQQLLSAIEQKAEQITWEAPIQEQLEDMAQEEIQEIPREKQFIVEHDEDEEQVFIEQASIIEEATTFKTENRETSASSPETSASDSLSTKDHKEKFVHPSLEQIPSEISDEDLVERDSSPSELETKCIFPAEETTPLHETAAKKDTFPSTVGDTNTKSKDYIEKAHEVELHHDFSSDDISKEYEISEAEKDDKQIAEYETHVDSYSSEGSDYTQRETEATLSSGAASEEPHYKHGYRQDSSETSDKESVHPLYVTAETLYTSRKKGKKYDSDPSNGAKEDYGEVVLRQKSASRKKDDSQIVGDIESWSSSGETESHYYSFEASDSSKTPQGTPIVSRPCSSEFEVTIVSGQPSSEYDTCVTSQEASIGVSESYATAATSQETSYSTACSSLSHSSRESAYSVDSESSGHLASLELSSEASETLVPSAQEIEMDLVQEIDTPILEEDTLPSYPAFKEPYDSEIPECIIRGGIEIPFLQDWSLQESQSKMSSAKEWLWPCEGEDQTAMSPFEIITTDDLAECLQESYQNQFQKCSKKVIEQGESLHDLDKKLSTNGNNLTSEKSSVDKFASENENQDDRAESEKYLQFSETSEFESHVTTVEIETVNVPGDEDIAEPLSHDELSISESSATQSEQTWQTSSIETAIHISQQMPPCFMPYTETPPVTRVDSTYSDVTTDQSSSPSHTAIVHDSPSQPAEEEISSISMYHQLNGPVEVDYIPEYDAPFADNRENASDPPVQTLLDNQLQQISHDAEGQEWQPPEEFMDGSSETCMLTESLEQTDEQRLSSDACNQNDQVPIRDSYQDQQQLMQHEHSGTLSTDLWHVKHEQVDELQELNKQQEIGASVTAPRQQEVFSGEASCLPESDQDTLHSWEVVHPSSEDYQIEKPKLETRDSFDMTDKAEAIDTSPEDDRYDNLLHDMEEQPCYMNSKDDSSAIIEEIEYAPVYQQELEPAESIQQATLERNDCESQATYMYSMGFEKEHIILPEGSIEPSVDDNFQEERSGLQGSFTESEFSHISYERGQEYDDVSLGYGELYTHQEEDEETEDTARYDGERQCNAAAMSAEDDKRSTPSYDTLSIRKFFGKSGEHDDMSVSSLQEFERLEAEISMGSRLSQGSGDSNGRQSAAKSGEQDDVSMNSLTEFEKFEKECTDGEYKESAPIDDVSRLSEIEEGHESLSEASQATLSDHLAKRDDSENSDDYEKRMNEIDEIIKQAQSNVEKFDDDSSIAHSLQKSLAAKNLHTASSDKIESSLIDISPLPKKHQESLEEKDRLCISQETQLPALLEREQTEQELELSPASLARHIIIGRTISGHSVESGESLPRSSTSTVTQYDAESLKDRDTDIEEMDVASIQDKKISPTEDDKYFPQEIDQDFQNKWSTQQYIDRSESDTNQTKDFCYVQPEIDYTAPETEYFMPPAEFKMPCDISTGEAFDIQWTEEESYLSAENLTAEIESIKAETVGSGHSSSNGKDGSGRGDCMISSTDSIDPSSSTATHATYQFETDSVMSSSINSAQASGEEFTMISSTDTLEAEPKISHVREHTFEEIPEAPHAEQQMFMEDDRIDSASFGQCVTIQVGTEEYESLPYEVKEKLNEMLAEPTIENETVDESQKSFCDSEIITVRKTTKYHSQSGAKKMLSHEHESQKFAEMQDVSGDQVFLSEDHLKEWRQNERAEYILGQTHMLSQFQYDGQTLRDSSYSMPDGTEALLYHPISPGVSPTAHQTHRSESDLDEPETFLTEAGETSAVSHGISPVTGS